MLVVTYVRSLGRCCESLDRASQEIARSVRNQQPFRAYLCACHKPACSVSLTFLFHGRRRIPRWRVFSFPPNDRTRSTRLSKGFRDGYKAPRYSWEFDAAGKRRNNRLVFLNLPGVLEMQNSTLESDCYGVCAIVRA
jgi:hypothetical protein